MGLRKKSFLGKFDILCRHLFSPQKNSQMSKSIFDHQEYFWVCLATLYGKNCKAFKLNLNLTRFKNKKH